MTKVSLTESSLKNIYKMLLGDVTNWDISISKEPNSILKSELQLSFRGVCTF